MKGLYKLHIDCGRQGEVEGLFIADMEDMHLLVTSGTTVYFGEILGKHSEVYGELKEKDYTFVTNDKDVINLVESYDLESGYNPFDYLDEDWKEQIEED